MQILTEIDEQNDETVENEDLYQIDHQIWIAREAARMGFPITGTMKDIYEDAVVLIQGLFRFDWGKKKIKIGRIIHIAQDGRFDVVDFVIQIADGTQVTCTYGRGYPIHFALPEDSEGMFV